MAHEDEPTSAQRREKKGPGRPRHRTTGLDTTGVSFQGTGSWQTVRFHEHAKRRDHRKLSLLVETRQAVEKFVYAWRLDTSRVGDVTLGMKLLDHLPEHTSDVSMDPAFDAHKIYDKTEENGAKPIIKPRKNARTGTVDARGRALRQRLRRPTDWQRRYGRRVITESVNYALKRRFGDRLWTQGLRGQRKEMALRILVYNTVLKGRWLTRTGYHGRDL